MRPSMLPIVFLLMPLVEIAGFVIVGKVLGLGLTLALVILSFVCGVILLRRQGLDILRQMRTQQRSGQMPGSELLKPVMSVVAALLLIVPGFVTDILALLLLVPAVQDHVWRFISKRMFVIKTSDGFTRGQPKSPAGPGVVDLDADDYRREPDPHSPWSGKRLGDQ
ncbi:FxsA family protein [Oryzifoliimicrobium ureilyticus]|uniref:FxsA family protein n=1 Tax=Oryzifoliimicrobium ureilyticus TaxID=3113724 RepID=UPI0030761A43